MTTVGFPCTRHRLPPCLCTVGSSGNRLIVFDRALALQDEGRRGAKGPRPGAALPDRGNNSIVVVKSR